LTRLELRDGEKVPRNFFGIVSWYWESEVKGVWDDKARDIGRRWRGARGGAARHGVTFEVRAELGHEHELPPWGLHALRSRHRNRRHRCQSARDSGVRNWHRETCQSRAARAWHSAALSKESTGARTAMCCCAPGAGLTQSPSPWRKERAACAVPVDAIVESDSINRKIRTCSSSRAVEKNIPFGIFGLG